MITDYYGQLGTTPARWITSLPSTLPWDQDTFSKLKEILEKVDALDKKLGLEHCEDPKKAEWMKAIEDRLQKLEAK